MSRSFGRSPFGPRKRRPTTAVLPAMPHERPDGQVLWGHATSELRLAALCDLGARLKPQRNDLSVLITWDPELMAAPAAPPEGCDFIMPLPGSPNGSGRQFLSYWQPDVGLWTGGNLWPGVIRQADENGIKLVLLDADDTGLERQKRRWFSDPMQEALSRFSHAFAADPAAADALRRAGLARERVEVTSPLRVDPTPPDCPDEEVTGVTQELAGRPVWLAAFTHPDEFGYVLTAQRSAVRLSHRLLLVIVLEDRHHLDDLLALLDGMTLRHTIWHLGDPIGDQLQVLVADDPEDLGLWYRIAPQTFIGHSLVPGESGRYPLDAATLGSAVLYGPQVGAHAEAYQRLAAAGAAQLVTDGNALGSQVSRLIAPDVTARMALAGWDVATEGAELTERLVNLLHDLLDSAGTPDAGA